MQIGMLARRVGVSVDAIRFYERNALLPVVPRTQGGFRRYSENDFETIAFIRRLQALGFRLGEIRAFLKLRSNGSQPCGPVRRRLAEKLADVRRRIEDLHHLERELRVSLRACDRELRRQPAHCPILQGRNPRPEGM